MAAGLRSLFAGTSRYMGSVAVGVLLAPVLPDIAVELFGDRFGTGWNPLLRVGAMVVVVGICAGAYQAQLHLATRRARRGGYVLSDIEERDVLVLPVGYTSGYSSVRRRTGAKTIQEWLIDTCRPNVVILVGTAQVAAQVAAIRAGLAEDPPACFVVELSDGTDPKKAVREAQNLVIALMEAESLLGRSTYVDTTGGSVPMSIAMLRLGALLGTQCTYIASDFKDKQIVPGTQRGRAFLPAELFAVDP